MCTGAALSAEVRIQCERGPISRNLFISIVKSLREDHKTETSITHDVCTTGKNGTQQTWWHTAQGRVAHTLNSSTGEASYHTHLWQSLEKGSCHGPVTWKVSGLGLWVSIDTLLHGLLFYCRHLVASLCGFGDGPVLPGRYPGTVVI